MLALSARQQLLGKLLVTFVARFQLLVDVPSMLGSGQRDFE
jgi:hypothetical protein